jgi:hypothetical protein
MGQGNHKAMDNFPSLPGGEPPRSKITKSNYK